MKTLKITSWNVNGLRNIVRKGFTSWLAHCEADMVGLQEIRIQLGQIPAELINPPGYFSYFSCGKRPGYSGVALYSKKQPDHVETSLGIEEFDAEGRMLLAYFGKLCLANVYFPNGKGVLADNSRIPFKLSFYKKLFEILDEKAKQGFRLVVMGDYNTAHTEIDLARPKENRNVSGFCQSERDEITRWLDHGYSDSFRMFNQAPNQYTWWSHRAGARERNVGWRIDYALVSSTAKPFVLDSHIYPEVMGSDHCPVDVWVDEKILE